MMAAESSCEDLVSIERGEGNGSVQSAMSFTGPRGITQSEAASGPQGGRR